MTRLLVFVFISCIVTLLYCCTYSNAQSRISSNCLNLTIVRDAVIESQIVFVGKLIHLRPVKDSIQSHNIDNLFSESVNTSSSATSYYRYNYWSGTTTGKKRRHSSANVVPSKSKPPSSSSSYFIGTVEVKTVFKGHTKKDSKLNDRLQGKTVQLRIDIETKDNSNNNNNLYCVRRLRVLDTRIFFYKIPTATSSSSSSVDQMMIPRRGGSRGSDDTLDLAQSLIPLPPTLGILSTVRQTVKDEPCAHVICSFGASCIVEHGGSNNKGVCRCPESCADHGYSPVCGSDRITYANECLLRKFACKHGKVVKVKRNGECADSSDICTDKTCPFGARCVPVALPSDDIGVGGDGWTCECPSECPSSIESYEICGSDGKMYSNECQLNLRSCQLATEITVKYLGKCDPCENVTCNSPHAICQLDNTRRPICACGEECPMEFNPVCASNGMTYMNECQMKQDACRLRTDLHIIYRGDCSSGVNPCLSLSCGGFESCVINRFGIAQCTCSMVCDEIIQPVCGSDGKAYDNYCKLTQNACNQQKEIQIAYKGICGSTSTRSEHERECANHKCHFGGNCIIRDAIPNCECPKCPSGAVESSDNNDLVCGSDGVTYENQCQLHSQSCSTNMSILIEHIGPCDPCKGYQCEFYEICVPDKNQNQEAKAKCVCPETCDIHLGLTGKGRHPGGRPVCGSDGQTYPNECELKKFACHQQKSIVVQSQSECDLCWNVHCKFGARCIRGICECPTNCPSRIEPVCGSNLQTFVNECELHKAICIEGTQISVLFNGNCSTETVDPELERINTPSLLFPSGPSGLQDGQYSYQCKCNMLGSVSTICDSVTKECNCRPGVGGIRCDRCLPGFWGLSRRQEEHSRISQGCTECGCSSFGSIRDDCEQMTGKCVCKSGVTGEKCDFCADDDLVLGPNGCAKDETTTVAVASGEMHVTRSSCDQVECLHGAQCEVGNGKPAECVCRIQCEEDEPETDSEEVCGSDGFTYDSECLVRLQSCRDQKSIWVIHDGPCLQSHSSESEAANTNDHNGQIAIRNLARPIIDKDQPGIKSTRHLHQQSNFHDVFQRTFFANRIPTSATIEMKSYLGDSCQSNSECVTLFSVCLRGFCVCKEGFHEDSERIQCKPIHSHAPKPISCNLSSCHKSATCLDHLNGSYSCICPLGITKHYPSSGCTRDLVSPVPLFNGNSTIVLEKLATGYHKLSIEMEIRPYLDKQHGLVLFSAQFPNGTGDFVSLALVDGFLEFRFDLGDGQTKLRSRNRLESGSVYVVAAKRYNRDALLTVNDEEEVQGSGPGIAKTLDLWDDGASFMGAVPRQQLNSTFVWETVGTSQGFIGCIDNFRVGRRPVEFIGTRDPLISHMYNVYQCLNPQNNDLPTTTLVYPFIEDRETENYVTYGNLHGQTHSSNFTDDDGLSTDFCDGNPCKNYGHCWNDESLRKGYRCICGPEFTGKLCETKVQKAGMEESGIMLDFRGVSFLELPTIDNFARDISIELWLMIRSPNGLVLYNGESHGKGDFVAISIENGHVQFLYELGSGIGNVTTDKPVALNKWHWIVAKRNGREGKLQIDGGNVQMGKSPPTLSELNLELSLYVGGIRDIDILHRKLDILLPFDGVLQYLKVNGRTYQPEIVEAVRGRQVHMYEGPPCGSSVSAPCENGGTCFPRLGSFSCVCPSAYMGKYCETRKDLPGPIRFHGENFIKFPKRILKRHKVQRRNRIEVVFRTTAVSSGILIWMGKPLLHGESTSKRRGYLGLFLVDGYLELRVNLGAAKHRKPVIIRSKVNVSDGRWHQVLIERRRRFVVFQVDGKSPHRATAPIGSNVLHTDGRIWIGGVATSVLTGDVPPKYHQGFIGCIDIVRIEKKRVPLSKIAYATGTPFCTDDD